jgi:hypothetical protein
MSGTSSKSQIIAIRLDNETIAKIRKAMASAANDATSVSDYCKKAVVRHAWRHEKDNAKLKEILG